MPTILRPHHTGIQVADLERSVQFYRDILGFEVGDDLMLGADFRWLTVFHPSQPNLHLHLTQPGPPLSDELVAAMRRAQAEGGLPGVGLSVDDCRTTHAELVAKGVDILVANEVGRPGTGFGSETNHAAIFDATGDDVPLRDWTKAELATAIVDRIVARLD